MPSAWLWRRDYARGRWRRLQEGALCYLWLCVLQVLEKRGKFSRIFASGTACRVLI